MAAELDSDKLERIAEMLAVGVPQNQIAEAMGISEGRITQLKEQPEFKEWLAEKSAKRFQEIQDVNDGWDNIERKAIETIRKKLNTTFDPDYALRAAMVANRATRKGVGGNVPLPAQMGDRVTLQLNQTFVGRMQNLSLVGESIKDIKSLKDILSHKRVNLMAPQQVKNLLLDPIENKDKVEAEGMGAIELV
jgi:hypothetical protein